jgi:CheY-like chemotaxis protein
MKNGPILIIDDDNEDNEIIQEIIHDLGVSNVILHFSRCSYAWEYLKTTEENPFLILCDVNLPEQNGLEFKMEIDADSELREKSIPFVFFSTSVDKPSVNKAYKEMTVQGFFKKEGSLSEMKNELNVIMNYWRLCHHPNS